MKVTESRFKNRQLHMEDYLQMVSAGQKEYAEVFDYAKITEKSGIDKDDLRHIGGLPPGI